MEPLDIYVVVVMGDQVLSLNRNDLGQVAFSFGISPYVKNTIPNEGVNEIIRLPVSSLMNIKADLYIGSLTSGKAIETFDFETLQRISLNY